MIVARMLDPGSKLATARGLAEATVRDSLADTLRLGAVDEGDLYPAMDWLGERQGRVERAPARRHLGPGALVLYDLNLGVPVGLYSNKINNLYWFHRDP